MKLGTTHLLHIIAGLCVASVAAALVSQHFFDMPPCAWCVFQRLLFLVIAVTCWAGILFGRLVGSAHRIAGVLAGLLALGGIVSGWYQYTVAAQMVSCDRTFADRFMVESGLDAGIPWLFGIFATCMDAQVELLGVEYVFWAIAVFVLVFVLGLVVALRRP
ncbi:MAG TPA: disulfide bond formation protein B [Burkholderiaceae bacterium]|nr:disulfide bond formation protein B [Burkholderiaceae bacterium]